MNFIENIKLLQRIDHLIRTKATGTPKQFSEKMDMSERTLYRCINELRELGIHIEYSDSRKSYRYADDINFKIDIMLNGKKLFYP